jgi:ligand-binding sensor domain-containing protein/signal transduction histidine kinase
VTNRGCVLSAVLATAVWVSTAWGLDPHKGLTQYSRTSWTQEQGLPQDTVRAIAQTADGYLWIGTDDGLARFDGYEFATFNSARGDLPSNSITALAAAPDGSLWIGTPDGLVLYRDKRFRTYTARDGLVDNAVNSLMVDSGGRLWVVAGVALSRFEDGHFTNYVPCSQFPVTSVRAVMEDREHRIWVAGFSGVGRLEGGRYVAVITAAELKGEIVSDMTGDASGNLWLAGSMGVMLRSATGEIRLYDQRDGLPDLPVRALWLDRGGNLWAGTNGGLGRFQSGRFASPHSGAGAEHDSVRALFEDREGDLWVGHGNGLIRYRDDLFSSYGTTEGLPSNNPNTVFQDHAGRIWVGFHDAGLLLFQGADGAAAEGGPDLVARNSRLYTTGDGLPSNEVYSIRETRSGDLLVAMRRGMARLEGSRFVVFAPPDPLGRSTVFDTLEDSAGRIWLASPLGLGELRDGKLILSIEAEPQLASAVVTLCEGRGGSLWAGTFGKGLWWINGAERRLFTVSDGLASNSIHALYQDRDGTLWIATFGGGLSAFRDGRFYRFTQHDGLLSDNLAGIADDGESLWLATTRGISRVAKAQLWDFAMGKRPKLEPLNYGLDDGLRSAQCAPGYPVGDSARLMRDGRLWFTTSRGLAVYDPRSRRQAPTAPAVHLVDATAGGQPLDLSRQPNLPPSSSRLQFRYTAIHLSAPERVEYSYKLEGLEPEWVSAGARRLINYNSLNHGSYRFVVRARIPGGPASEQAFAFVLLPYFYETVWFRLLILVLLLAAAWAVYQMRLRQIRYRFGLVLDERARLAREIHDTLAQGFVGISSQLDAVAMCMPDEKSTARQHLDMARRMARHSLTEARRSVMDLRASVLEGQDLSAALESGARMWTAGSPLKVSVEVSGPQDPLPQEMEQHLLRIAQEAVTNVLKHAAASRIGIKLDMEEKKLRLRIVDNGAGFEERDVFSSHGGHFGLLGMRERAQRLGGELHLASRPGSGTEVEVEVPLP